LTKYIALIRAVNVGGTGKLPMSELKSTCEDAGFLNVLRDRLGKPAGVIVRTDAEMQTVVKANPFKKEAPKCSLVIFLDAPRAMRSTMQLAS